MDPGGCWAMPLHATDQCMLHTAPFTRPSKQNLRTPNPDPIGSDANLDRHAQRGHHLAEQTAQTLGLQTKNENESNLLMSTFASYFPETLGNST
eukprot:1550890-Rhodomonas_salina.4